VESSDCSSVLRRGIIESWADDLKLGLERELKETDKEIKDACARSRINETGSVESFIMSRIGSMNSAMG